MVFVILPFFLAILSGYYFYPGIKLPKDIIIDRLVVYKSRHRMEAWSNGSFIKAYTISLGRNPVGHKEYEGDMRTPEGIYTINARNPHSAFHKNLGVSYPNDADRAHAASLGKLPGGDIKIHGLRNGRGYISKFHRFKNWTHGCIAVTNPEIDALYAAVKDGAVIEILP